MLAKSGHALLRLVLCCVSHRCEDGCEKVVGGTDRSCYDTNWAFAAQVLRVLMDIPFAFGHLNLFGGY